MGFKTYLFLFGLSLVRGIMWIPKHELGFVYKRGNSEAQIKIDIFVDLLCPESKEAFHTMLKVVEGYKNNQIQLKTYMTPLPYHTFAFIASKTVYAVSKLTDDIETYNWMSTVFEHMSLFSGHDAKSKTEYDIIKHFDDLLETHKIDKNDFTRMIFSDAQTAENTVLASKYSTSRGIHSVPWFMINDVTIDAAKWSVKDWKNQLDKLLAQ